MELLTTQPRAAVNKTLVLHMRSQCCSTNA